MRRRSIWHHQTEGSSTQLSAQDIYRRGWRQSECGVSRYAFLPIGISEQLINIWCEAQQDTLQCSCKFQPPGSLSLSREPPGCSTSSVTPAAYISNPMVSALRFFTAAPPTSRTTAGLARYQGMSLGPVAQTVRPPVEKRLLACVANPVSRRAYHMRDAVAISREELLELARRLFGFDRTGPSLRLKLTLTLRN